MLAKLCKQVCVAVIVMLALLPATQAWSAGWELVFSDEFNGDKLDRNKWATRFIYNNETLDHLKDEIERYRDNHVISDGVLNMTARKMEGSNLFESAMIRSQRTFYYGYFEARVFLPNAKGVWPAFWLEADYDIDGKTWWPPEIDIFEFVINGVEDKANSLHSNTAGPWSRQSYTYLDRNFLVNLQNMYDSEDLNKDWHIAGYVWAPDKVSMFWDGKLIYTRNFQWLRKDGQLGPPAHVDLNFAVGGPWAGRHGLDEAAFPQTFKVDYVRVCQFTQSDKGARQCGPSEVTPDPKQFGYTAPINDLAKPVFLPVNKVAGNDAAGGVVSLKTAQATKVDIPIRLPDNYPSNRTLQVWLAEDGTRSTAGWASTKLQPDALTKRADGASVAEVSLPPVSQAGSYTLVAKLMSDVTDEKGSKYALPSPIACNTAIAQPEKALSCRLLSLRVQ